MTRSRTARSQQGFTLIEVLLVVVLIGVLMGVAVISLNPEDPARRLLRERERLQGQIQYARLFAESEQVEVGIDLHGEGYDFLRFRREDRSWQSMSDDPALKARRVPGIDFDWRDAAAQGRAAPAAGTVPAAEGQRLPDLLLLSSGEATPGVITLSSRDDPRTRALELNITDLGDAAPAEADRGQR